MGLSAHEMIIMLRARDEMSRVLNQSISTLTNLKSTQEASRAATQNLDVATQKYNQGLISSANLAQFQKAQEEALNAERLVSSRNMEMQGKAITSVGIAMVGFGALAAGAFISASNASSEYRNTSSLTFTQVDNDIKGTGKSFTSLQDVMNIGKEVAGEYAVKFEQIQPALYDVFSTIETDGKGAKIIMEGIAKAAIAGGTDMQTAGKSIMGIMNAWKMAATDVNEVNAVMFKTVQKGTGTYDEFSAAIGKATPSTVKAHQSVETLAAMLAFMTKNGMTAAQAGTSAARAFDMLTNPKFAENVQKFGIKVFDATGQIRPMGDVVEELRKKLDTLSDEKRLQAISDIGKGAGGTIQAMRFLNLGLEDVAATMGDTRLVGTTLFQDLQREMEQAKVQAENFAKAQELFANPAIGDALKDIGVQAFDSSGKLKPLADLANDLKTQMIGLSDTQKQEIITKIGTEAGLSADQMKILKGVIEDTDNSMGYLGDATDQAYQIMKNTPEAQMQGLKNQFELFRISVGDALAPVREFVVGGLTELMKKFNELDPNIRQTLITVGVLVTTLLLVAGAVLIVVGTVMMIQGSIAIFGALGIGIGSVAAPILIVIGVVAALIAIGYLLVTNWDTIKSTALGVWDQITSAVKQFADGFMQSIQPFIPAFQMMWGAISNVFSAMIKTFTDFAGQISAWWTASVQPVFDNIATKFGELLPTFNQVGQAIGNVFAAIGTILMAVFTVISTVVMFIVTVIGSTLMGAFTGLWIGVQAVIQGIMGVLGGLVNFFTGVFTGNIQLALAGIGQIFGGLVEIITGLVVGLGTTVLGAIVGLVNGVIGFFTNLYDVVVGHSIIPDMVTAIITWIMKLPENIGTTIGNMVTDFINKVNNLKDQVVNGFNTLVSDASNKVSALPGQIISFVTEMSTGVVNKADEMGKGFLDKVNQAKENILNVFRNLPNNIKSALGDLGSLLYGAGEAVIRGLWNGLKAMWENAKSWITGIADWISQHKGPIEKDRKLLVPAGKAIMGGFLGSLKDAYKDVQSFVKGVGANITATAMVKTNDYINTYNPYNSLPNNAYGSIDNSVHVDVTVNTEEIDPVKQAANLGYEIAGRLGL